MKFFGIRPRLTACIALVLLAVVVPAGSQQSGASGTTKAQKIDALLESYSRYHQFNGAVLVAEHGKIILRKGYGMADLEWSIPNSPETKFRLGSVSKQFTATLIVKLVERGKLALDGKLADYLPYYRKDTGARISIENLLTHITVLPNYTDRPDYPTFDVRPYSPEEFVKQYCSGDLQFEPGSKFQYSNSNYFILGAVIEQLTGKPYKQVLREEILEPLGMNDSGYDEFPVVLPRRAKGYTRFVDKFENAKYFDSSVPYAAGSLYSTVDDLYKWDQALYSDAVLPEKYKAMMFQPRLQDYALGWFVAKVPEGQAGAGNTRIWHPGGIDGFMTLIERYVPDRNLIILLNNTGLFPQKEIQEAIEAILYDKPYSMPKPPIAEVLERTIEEKGVAAAVSQFRQLKGASPDDYDFGELQLYTLGQLLVEEKRLADALAIAQLWVEVYPKSLTAYLGLGDAYMSGGQKEQAIATYKKALELDPTNSFVAGKLKQAQQ